MRPTVISWEPPNELRWRSTFLAQPPVHRRARVSARADRANRVRFVQDETSAACLCRSTRGCDCRARGDGFDETNEALRDRAEKIASESGDAL